MLEIKTLHHVHNEIRGIFPSFLDEQHFDQVLRSYEEDNLAILAIYRVALNVSGTVR